MSWAAILTLAGGTYLLRLSGLLLAERLELPPSTRRNFDLAATALLMALAVTAALTEGGGFAGWSRTAAVAAAAAATLRGVPFVGVVLLAAAVAALLRAAGVA